MSTSTYHQNTAATQQESQQQLAKNYDLMLLQLCFDVSEFDDYEEEEDQEQQQQNEITKPTEDMNKQNNFDPFAFVASRQQHVSLQQLEKDLQKYANHLNQSMLNCVHDEVYESFTHVAAQLGNTSKRLSTVKAPLSHYLERIKHSSATVEKARSEIETGLQESAQAEMERRFYAARVESALLARSLNQFLTSPAARTVVASSGNGGNNNRNASLSNNKRAHSEDFGSPSPSPGNKHKDISAENQHQNPSVNSNVKNLLEQLPSSCQSLRRLNQLLDEMRSCVSSISEVSTSIETQQAEIKAFSESCSALEHSLVSLMCSAFDVCYYDDVHHHQQDSVVASSSIPEMKRLCELFASMGRVSSFVEYFRDSIVRPLVEDVVSWRAASQARQSPEDAAKLLSSLRSALGESGPLSLVPLLQKALTGEFTASSNSSSDEASATAADLSSTSLLIVASWSATADTIMKRALFLFNPGIPSHFHKHFTIANELLAAHEMKCASAAELCALRTSPEVGLWVRKWNVDVYHALRQKELNQSLDEEILAGDQCFGVTTSSSSSSFKTQTVAQIYDKMKNLIDPSGDVFLFSLQHRFLRDIYATIQKLVSKGKSCLEEQFAAAKNDDQKFTSVVKLWSNIRSDFTQLANEVRNTFPHLIEKGCSGSWSDAKTAQVPPTEFATLFAEEILSSIVSVDSVIKSSITKQCMANLSNVKSIKTAFSMTKKSVPTEPSSFLQGALNPLASFYSALKNSENENASDTRAIILDISKDILTEFADLVKEIVISSRKAQESLEKLRRARAGGVSSSADSAPQQQKSREVTDRDKIVVQLYLDISELVNVMRRFGVNAESFQPFRNLFALVKRAPWVLSNFEGEEPEEVEE